MSTITTRTMQKLSKLALCAIAVAIAAIHSPLTQAKQLKAFESDKDLLKFIEQKTANMRKQERERTLSKANSGVADMVMSSPPPAATAPAAPMAMAAESKASVAGTSDRRAAGAASDNITNNQTQGVDEGGIVKVHGDHLVVLRRGRLFTVRVAGPQLEHVSTVNAYGPGNISGGAWYDEMLISGNTIAVVGYSYQRGGTEIGLFDITSNGQLSHRHTYHMRSNDYYSSRNYASRLIGNKLIFYTPLMFNMMMPNPLSQLPGVRRFDGQTNPDFSRIAPANKIFRLDDEFETSYMTMHAVTQCDLSVTPMRCDASAVLGPSGHVFYVSADSVFVWVSTSARHSPNNMVQSAVVRMPLDGSTPSALRTTGVPIDQFSFLQTDQHLNVLLQAQGGGQWMWQSEGNRGARQLALMRVPLNQFAQDIQVVPGNAYTPLPSPNGNGSFQNRYVGQHLLYGVGQNYWNHSNTAASNTQSVYALKVDSPRNVTPIELGHGVDRIEQMGGHAVVVGLRRQVVQQPEVVQQPGPAAQTEPTSPQWGNTAPAQPNPNFMPTPLPPRPVPVARWDLVFSSINLSSRWTSNAVGQVASQYVQPNASQAENRSHGFFYRPDDERDGLLGLPIRTQGQQGAQRGRFPDSSAIVFLRNRNLTLSDVGQLAAQDAGNRNDNCVASCVDWYGNARPIFMRGRVFALMGYELVEGRVNGGRGQGESITEVQRVRFSPNSGWGRN